MLKSLNKLSTCYKLNLNVSTTTTTATCGQLLFYTKTGGTGPFTKRNSYTHKQDVRKIKRRELRGSDEPTDIIVDTKPNSQPKVKPSHLHSKPITHDTKIQQLEHHHQKKLERIEKQKEQQRNQLIESLTLDQQQEQKKLHDDQLQEQESNQSLENERSNKKLKRQLSQQERLKQIQYGIDHEEEDEEDDSTTSTDNSSSSSSSTLSEGRPEYSNKLSTNGETSFETDLSYYDLKSNSKIPIPIEPLDFSKINQNDIIDIDEMDLSNFEKDDDSIGQDARIMSIEDAHKRFKFTDQELAMLLKHAKEQKLQQSETIDEGNEYEQYEEEIDDEDDQDEEALVLKEEISNYERLLNEKKEKLLEKEARKQFKSDLALSKEEIKQSKKLKKQQDKLLKKQTKQMKKKSYLEQQQQEEQGEGESISVTQQDLMSKQKVIQHIQTLHAKKVKEANIKERDLTPLKINEVMEFLAETQLDDFCVVDVSKKCSWAKYLVIASSDSTRLLSNTEDDIIHHFRNRFEQLSSNSQNSDEWRVVDLKTVVIHLFETKTREHYDLETLWVTRRELDSPLEESWDDEMTSKIGEDDEDD